MRNIKGKVRVSDRKEAETVLHAFYDKYDSKYSSMIKNLQKIEEDLLVFYQYPKQIRLSIYSTNMIESINNMIKRKTKPKSEF
ncbi:transposase, partial [Lactobacillus delbrueckii subsp. bulgaricus]|nr:IS256 family transposase [Lactobacillus delbrueckii subsp. bulgaricus]